MNQLNVLVVSRMALYPAYLDEIAAVDPRISIKDATALLAAELRSEGRQGMWLKPIEEDIKNNPPALLDKSLDELLAEAEVIYGVSFVPSNLVQRAPRLKWAQFATAGVDSYMAGLSQANILITSSRGAHAPGVAEHIMALSLGLARKFPTLMASKPLHRGDRVVSMELGGRVMAIIGSGAIGTEAARMAHGFGMKVIGIKKSATKHEFNVGGLDELYPASELPAVLALADIVALAVPLTPETKKMIGEKQLRSMKPSAYLVNVARGGVVDQAALITALKGGWIAGAGLDVYEQEPLPPESELWDLPNVILTPHVAGWTDQRPHRLVRLFCDNLRRYLAGETLVNLVDAKRGY